MRLGSLVTAFWYPLSNARAGMGDSTTKAAATIALQYWRQILVFTKECWVDWQVRMEYRAFIRVGEIKVIKYPVVRAVK
jgi:hypothetical protein